MKKLYLTILFTLVLSGGVNAKIDQYEEQRLIDNGTIKVGMYFKEWRKIFGSGMKNYSYLLNDFLIMCVNKKYLECGPGKAYLFEKTTKRGKLITDFIGWKSFNNYRLIRIDDKVSPQLEQVSKLEPKALKHLAKINRNKPQKNSINNNVAGEQVSQTIEFNIKQKKEQCTAIGFKPETEKFADCVLRLVELDVKQQQSNKIAQAQNSGNDALVKQLQQQQYDRGTDALLNLGQQLLNPGTTNSNVYMPQTQRCTIQGFGTFAKMVCR